MAMKNVQVALRIRPLVPIEIANGCKDILDVFPELEQVKIRNSDKAFTYNHIFPAASTHESLYNESVKPLIDNIYKGYNVTILAYGQTGSGKTHSMGTTYSGEGEMGVIPRAVNDIFVFVKDNFTFNFHITVSFMELYQEVLYDLLSEKPREQCVLDIREDAMKSVMIPGLTESHVESIQDVFDALRKGSLGRATGATNMNAQSSRSHAIFTINVAMQSKINKSENRTAKFQLVDLAGSERQKKTGATGGTLKEGININKGLLALGNVISALGDEKDRHGYIPYRDNILTRLLKDSLGGNSTTLMIACVSPSDDNMEETLSTLRYADRARKIQNKQQVSNKDLKFLEKVVKAQGWKHADDVFAVQREYQEKNAALLRQQDAIEDLLRRTAILVDNNEALQKANQELMAKLHEKQEKLNKIGNLAKESKRPLQENNEEGDFESRVPKKHKRLKVTKLADATFVIDDNVAQANDVDVNLGPDTKETPVLRRRCSFLEEKNEALKTVNKKLRESLHETETVEHLKAGATLAVDVPSRNNLKRSPGDRCRCRRTKCASKVCGCKKRNMGCTAKCKCGDDCENRESSEEE